MNVASSPASEVDALAVSVVIAFKDWGVDRLLAAVRHLHDAIRPADGEIIVSDYGSVDGPVLRSIVEAAGARYVYTETNGIWSRSRALNAGFASARGRVLISTDADMLFSPGSIARIAELTSSRTAVVLQCRDLPEGYSEERFLGDEPVNWDHLAEIARIRPRWGMGGMMAVTRQTYEAIRGFDERMEIYGGEDVDFANRVRRSGTRLQWLEEPGCRMYHMWHAPTRAEVSKSEEGLAAIKANSAIMTSDPSVVRNLPVWRHDRPGRDPLVSVVISTYNRAQHLRMSIESVLAQSFQDFELIIVDDGSTDDTQAVASSFNSPKVRYYKRASSGIAASRNFAASVSRGKYTAVHDDDDIMLPWRLERSLRAITEGTQGSTSGWINFDDASGELTAHTGKDYSFGSLLYAGAVYLHPTLMVETRVLQEIGYDENLRSGSDYNLALRMARAGVKLAHTRTYAVLRRLHPGQVTNEDSATQRRSARSTLRMVNATLSPENVKQLRHLGWLANQNLPRIPSRDFDHSLAFLPDHLCSRALVVDSERAPLPSELASKLTIISIFGADGQLATSIHCVANATWNDYFVAATNGNLISAHQTTALDFIGQISSLVPTLVVPALWDSVDGPTALVLSPAEQSTDRAPDRESWTITGAGAHEFRYRAEGHHSAEEAEHALVEAATQHGPGSTWMFTAPPTGTVNA